MKNAWIGLAAILVSACGEPADDGPVVELVEVETPNAADICAVIDSRNWQAWVDAMPGPNATPTLHVTGEVDLPTPGYQITWRLGALDRMQPPGQRLIMETTPADGMVAQVITTVGVSYAGESAITDYREAIVVCGDEVLATIRDVTVAR